MCAFSNNLILIHVHAFIIHMIHANREREREREMAIVFWYDAWNGTPLRGYNDGKPRPLCPTISLRDALPISHQLDPLLPKMEINFSVQADTLLWRWEGHESYTAKSIYRILGEGGKERWTYDEI